MTDQPDQAGGIAGALGFDTSRPNVARVYDCLLGGKDHFAADRQAARRLIETLPSAAAVARANRRFLAAAVRHAARDGIAQYLDIGAGLPTSPSVHECARAIVPGARVAYVDNDPVAVTYAQALLATGDGVIAIDGDARDPEAILAGPGLAAVIDLTEPVCLALVSMLHFFTADEADKIAASRPPGAPPPRSPRTSTASTWCRLVCARRGMASGSAGRVAAATPAGAAHVAAGGHAGWCRAQADLKPRGLPRPGCRGPGGRTQADAFPDGPPPPQRDPRSPPAPARHP